MASLLSMRNLIILAVLALSSLGLNGGQLWHLWKTEAADKAQYNLLASANESNAKVQQDLSTKLAACVGKATASDEIAQTAQMQRDAALAQLANALKNQSVKKAKIYETPDCKKVGSLGVCPAVSDGLRLGRPASG